MEFTEKRNRAGIMCVWCDDMQSTQSRLEDAEQIDAMSHINERYPELMAFHVANEGMRTSAYGHKLKRKGCRSGVPDIVILRPTIDGKHSLSIEIKRANKNQSASISKAEAEFLLAAESSGSAAYCCYGYQAALYIVDRHYKAR